MKPQDYDEIQKVIFSKSDYDLVETLASLGYKKDAVRAALGKVPESIKDMEPRLKAALKILSGK